MIFGIEGTKPNRIFHDPTTLDMNAAGQFRDCLDQEYAVEGALMPDCHLGYTMPIGGVISTRNALYPSWVGYDIGCGVLSIKTPFDPSEVSHYAEQIYHKITRSIPVGMNKHKEGNDYERFRENLSDQGHIIWDRKGGSKHLGTLGGGNHFIEVGKGQKDEVYITIHSGSRGIGHGIASHYIALAHPEGKQKEGSYPLLEGTQDFEDYLNDLNFCLNFARANRMTMYEEVVSVICDTLGIYIPSVGQGDIINRNHNHAEYDKESGLWIHRKGATHAEKKMRGVIPGNMRDGVVITVGLGHKASLNSSSHGAGRKMGRNVAKKKLNHSDFVRDMDCVKACSTSVSKLDESPRAYKDFDEVISQQEGILFDVLDVVKPIINVKG